MILARTGAGPLDGGIALPGGLYQASKGRALAENTRLSRSRNDRIRRTLDWAEWVTGSIGCARSTERSVLLHTESRQNGSRMLSKRRRG